MITTISGNGWQVETIGETAKFKYLTEEITISSEDFPKGKSVCDLRVFCTKNLTTDIATMINKLNAWFEC